MGHLRATLGKMDHFGANLGKMGHFRANSVKWIVYELTKLIMPFLT